MRRFGHLITLLFLFLCVSLFFSCSKPTQQETAKAEPTEVEVIIVDSTAEKTPTPSPGETIVEEVITTPSPTQMAEVASTNEPGGEIQDITFNLLRKTRYDEASPPVFDKQLVAMDNKRVRMKGFMSPFDDLNNMSNFMVMSTATGCFFCVPPSIEEVALIRQKDDGTEKPFIYEPIIIEGTLKLWDAESDDTAYEMFLYVIADATVRAMDPSEDQRSEEEKSVTRNPFQH